MIIKTTRNIAFFCYILSIYFAISIDIYLPSLPNIAKTFSTTANLAQLTISLFLFGFAIGQIFYGFIADYFGRKKSILIGLVLYFISSIGCMSSKSIITLLIFRIIQSFGACGASVSAYAIARDFYDGKMLTRIFANMSIIMTVVPSIAPFIGGLIDQFYSWRAIFILLAGTALLTISLSYYIPKDNSHISNKIFSIQKIINDYYNMLTDKTYIYYVLISTSIFLALYVFIISSPFIFIKMLNFDFAQYGELMAVNALFLACGNHLSKSIDVKFGPIICITMGTVIMLIGSVCMLFFAYIYPFLYFFPMFLCSIGIGIISPSAMSSALEFQKQKPSQASALAGFIRFSIPILISTLIYPGFIVTAAVIIFCALFNCLLIFIIRKSFKDRELCYDN